MRTRINIVPFYRHPSYARNYEKNCYHDHICECCGKPLNSDSMKQIQMLESGHWTDETREVKAIYNEKGEWAGHSQGFWYIGPDCYKRIMEIVRKAGESKTIEVEL